MIKYKYFHTVFFLICSISIYSQKTVVSGKVIDSETNEPVPYTNIGFQHSLIGTISETDGSFYLTSMKATDTLLVSSVGYELVRLHVTKGIEQVFEAVFKHSGND